MVPPDAHRTYIEPEVGFMRSALRDWENFARRIPHELKAPLATMEAFAGALQEREGESLTERGRAHLEAIRRSAAHGRSLAEALLILAPLSTQPMREEQVDLSSLARECFRELQAREPHREVDVRIEPALSAWGDPHLLRGLLGNLLGNAWKFTSTRAAARIELGTASAGAHRVFRIEDNGVGFDMAYAGELFSPLVRLHGSSEFAGSGLGLAMARQIVERHGGLIWANADENAGARFYFSLGPPPTDVSFPAGDER